MIVLKMSYLTCLRIIMLVLFLHLSYNAFAQNQRLIRGQVQDASDGSAMVGVNILVKGTGRGVTSDNTGSFSIRAANSEVLIISYSGFRTQEIPVGSKTVVNITLTSNTSTMDEVVVVGYGSVRKKDLTGSVAIVKMDDMEKAPVASFAEALAGRVAGVQVTNNDGQPGSGMEITIRGANSLTQSNTPLYVIDGFAIEDPDPASLNPDDILSITILKDASSTAIYGSRGANGVVVIETKKGRSSKPVVTFNTQMGIQKLLKKMELMSPYEFVKMQYDWNAANAASLYFINGRTLDSYKDIPKNELQDRLFQTAVYKNYSLALRGVSGRTNYSISGSINNQEGVVLNSGYNRYQGRVALDQAISPKLKTGIILNYSNSKAFGQRISSEPGFHTNAIMFKAWGYRPVSGDPTVDLLEDESDASVLNSSDVRLNPVITIQNEHIVTQSANLLGNAYVQYNLLKDLTLKVTGSANNTRIRGEEFYNSRTTQGNKLNPQNSRGVWGSINYTDLNVWSNENILTYNKALNQNHKITVLGGFSQQGYKTSLHGFTAQKVPNEELGIAGLDEGVPLSVRSTASRNVLQSFFGRVDYNFRSTYLLTGSFRADGSSKFAADNRWAYFPAAGFRWNMHNESFMKSSKIISTSAIRLSYGVSGNNRVSDFGYLSALSLLLPNSYSFNNGTPTPGVIPGNLGNSQLKWESTTSIDFAYEVGLFKNRIELTAELYRKTTNDLLLNADLPSQTGFLRAFKNIGSIRNEGLELTLNTINVRSKNFTWESNFNISFNKNQIIELTQGQQNLFTTVSFATGWTTPLYLSQIGQPAGMMYGYIFDGVYQYADFENPSPGVYILSAKVPTNGNQRAVIKPGDIKYKDLNGDGIVNTFDQAIIGRGQPLHTGGFVNNFTYKGFNLNVFFQWSYGNDIYNANRLMFEGNANGQTFGGSINQYASYNDRWTPENPSNKNYRAGGNSPIGMWNSRVVEDGSYLRLKTVSLGYEIPEKFISKLYLSKLSLNVAAQNLFTITNYTGVDPEVSTRSPRVLAPGFDFSAYPRSRVIVFSLNATF